jgi:hypothetical protein
MVPLERLDQVLAGSSEAVRPVARLELPLKLDRFVTAQALARMRPAAVLVETFELPLARLLAEGAFERKALSREGFNVPFMELNHAGHRIWGATAGILWNLRQKLLGRDE